MEPQQILNELVGVLSDLTLGESYYIEYSVLNRIPVLEEIIPIDEYIIKLHPRGPIKRRVQAIDQLIQAVPNSRKTLTIRFPVPTSRLIEFKRVADTGKIWCATEVELRELTKTEEGYYVKQ